LSMTLRACFSRCTCEFVDEQGEDEILFREGTEAFAVAGAGFARRVRQQLDRLRASFARGGRFRIATENSFPAGAGLASSASGFSALTLAALSALGQDLTVAERSAWARRSGSGSAARSVIGGYVQWPASERAESFAFQVHGPEHWDLRDVIAVVETKEKDVSSLDGHRLARTSPYFNERLRLVPERLARVNEALARRDMELLGSTIEAEAIDLHVIAMTSNPAIFYWKPATLSVLEKVRRLRQDGIKAYSTMDAGANVHVICPAADEPAVAAALDGLEGVDFVLRDGVGPGPLFEDEHLF
jgi:diphosphomevalonate decarboxylase